MRCNYSLDIRIFYLFLTQLYGANEFWSWNELVLKNSLDIYDDYLFSFWLINDSNLGIFIGFFSLENNDNFLRSTRIIRLNNSNSFDFFSLNWGNLLLDFSDMCLEIFAHFSYFLNTIGCNNSISFSSSLSFID